MRFLQHETVDKLRFALLQRLGLEQRHHVMHSTHTYTDMHTQTCTHTHTNTLPTQARCQFTKQAYKSRGRHCCVHPHHALALSRCAAAQIDVPTAGKQS